MLLDIIKTIKESAEHKDFIKDIINNCGMQSKFNKADPNRGGLDTDYFIFTHGNYELTIMISAPNKKEGINTYSVKIQSNSKRLSEKHYNAENLNDALKFIKNETGYQLDKNDLHIK